MLSKPVQRLLDIAKKPCRRFKYCCNCIHYWKEGSCFKKHYDEACERYEEKE